MRDERKSMVKRLMSREIGFHPKIFQSSHSHLLRLVTNMRPMFQLEHHPQSQLVKYSHNIPKQTPVRTQIARLRFNRTGGLVGTSYYTHDSIELWPCQGETGNMLKPIRTFMGCSVVRFDWLYTDPEAHIIVVGKYGQIKLIDLRNYSLLELISRQPRTSLAYGLHPRLPCTITYGMRCGMVRNFDVRKRPGPEDALVKATNKDGTPYEIFSLQINPVKWNEFAIAGAAEDVRIYDRRMADKPMHSMYMVEYPTIKVKKPGTTEDESNNQPLCLNNGRRSPRWNLQEMRYNYNGTQLSVNCGYDAIYLFDTSMNYPIGSFNSKYLDKDENGLTCTIKKNFIYGIEYLGQQSDYMIATTRGNEHTNGSPSFRKKTSVFVWNTINQKLVRRIPLAHRNWNFDIHPGIPMLATTFEEKGIQLWGMDL